MKSTRFNLKEIQENLNAGRPAQAIPWFMVIGGLLIVTVGLVTRQHANPYLIPAMVVIGMDGVLIGLSLATRSRRPRVALWLIALSLVAFLLFLYLLVRMFLF